MARGSSSGSGSRKTGIKFVRVIGKSPGDVESSFCRSSRSHACSQRAESLENAFLALVCGCQTCHDEHARTGFAGD